MAIGPEGEALVAIDKLIDKYVAEPLREKMHEELFALLPEKVEVMSEEEIKNKICNFCVKSKHTAFLCRTTTDTCLAVRFAIGALSGCIAKSQQNLSQVKTCVCEGIEKQKPVEKIDKEQILRILHRNDYIHSLHSKIKAGLIGSLQSQYLGYNNYNTVNKVFETTYFKALVDMFTANLIYSATDKLVEEVIKAVNELRENLKGDK
jgi:hypothetical protein